MAYSDTLSILDRDSNLSDDSQTIVDTDKEEVKALTDKVVVGATARKMTIDFGEKANSPDRNNDRDDGNKSRILERENSCVSKLSEGTRSLLTVETEQMEPLAATECIPSTARSSTDHHIKASASPARKDSASASKKSDVAVDDIVASCFSAKAYQTQGVFDGIATGLGKTEA